MENNKKVTRVDTKRIYSKNSTFQKLKVLKTNRNKRYKYNEFIIEGVRNINGAIKNNWQINSFIYLEGRTPSRWAANLLENCRTEVNYELDGDLMTELSGKEETSELIAVARMNRGEPATIKLSDNPILALFDRPSNKGNLGTFFRSCDAFGVEQVIITGHSVDVYDPDVITSSMGSFFSMPFITLADNMQIDGYIDMLRQQYPQLKVIGTDERGQTAVFDIDMNTPILFLMGNETHGINRHLLDICDVVASIPMSGNSSASSLNVSCAATVVLYEAARQRAKLKIL